MLEKNRDSEVHVEKVEQRPFASIALNCDPPPIEMPRLPLATSAPPAVGSCCVMAAGTANGLAFAATMQEKDLPRFIDGSVLLNTLEFPKMFTFDCAAVPDPVQVKVTPFALGGVSRLPMFVHVRLVGNSVVALNAATSGPAALDSVH